MKISSSVTFELHLKQLINSLTFFKEFLEGHGIKTLKNHFKKVREKTLQFILCGILFSHFYAFQEIQQGDGYIDFFVIGPENNEIIIETKMSDAENYIEGIRNQLPTYLRQRKAKVGIFVLFYIDGTPKRINEIEKEIDLVKLDYINEFHLFSLLIDLRKRPSPSKIVSYQELRDIPGVGSARAEKLYKAGFISINSIKNSSIGTICSETGLSEQVVSSIKKECENMEENISGTNR